MPLARGRAAGSASTGGRQAAVGAPPNENMTESAGQHTVSRVWRTLKSTGAIAAVCTRRAHMHTLCVLGPRLSLPLMQLLDERYRGWGYIRQSGPLPFAAPTALASGTPAVARAAATAVPGAGWLAAVATVACPSTVSPAVAAADAAAATCPAAPSCLSRSPQSRSASISCSKSASLCAADRLTRSRLVPRGTVGGRMAGT